MRTKCLGHRDLGYNQRALFHQDQLQLLRHWVHTRLEFDGPTRAGARYTNHLNYRPNQSNEVQVLLVQS